MRISVLIGALSVLALLPGPLLAQANPGVRSGPLGGWQNASNNPGTGTGDMPGSSVGLPPPHAGGDMPKGAYGLDLSQRMAVARKLVDEVAHGRVLTDDDTRHVRNLMREDFIAWNKRYDLPPSAYRKERDKWIVPPEALTPKAWAQQRLDWLEAQRAWDVARGG